MSSLPGSLQELVEQLLRAGNERVIHGSRDVGAGRGGAVLAAVDEGAGGRSPGRGLDICVLEDDERRLAAKLEMDPLQVARGKRLNPPARLGGAGQRDEIHVRMGGDRRPDDVATPGHDVEDSGRDAGLVGQFGQPNGRQRRRRP